MKKISIFLLLILSLKVHAMRNPFEVDEAWFARIEAAPTTEWPQDFAQAPVGKWLKEVREASVQSINSYNNEGKTLLMKGITIPYVSNLHRLAKIALNNRPDIDVNKPDWAGIPPVWQAIIQHDEELLKLFLSRGAHVKNVRIHAEPILVAAIQRYLNGDEIRIAKSPQASKKATLEFYQNSIKLLVGSGCSLEEKSTQGFKPLWLAAQANHVDLTKALLDVGAFAYAGPTSTMNDAIKLVNQRLDEGLVEFIQ